MGSRSTWAHTTHRDTDGFLTSPSFELATSNYALASEDIDLASRPGDWWPSPLADVRFELESPTSVFVGIGSTEAVNAYLAGVPMDHVTRLGPGESDVTYRTIAGDLAPRGTPAEQTFWAASAEGTSPSLEWEVTEGEWSVVVMNTDASPGVAVTARAGVRIGIMLAVGIALLFGGLLLGGAAAFVLVWATRDVPGDTTGPATSTSIAGWTPYPVVVTGQLDPGLSRGMWLVKWLLAIPHLIVLAFLWMAFVVLSIVAFFAIVITGRYPRGIFDFNVGVLRWNWRVGFYAFSAIGTDRYPPFTLEDTNYPARLDVAYPERLSRGLVLVKSWLLAIPHYLIVGVLTSGLVWWATDGVDADRALELGGGVIGLLVVIAGIALLFTGRYPRGLFDLLIGLNRWVYRVAAYASLMRDEYPPFRLDLGEDEPSAHDPEASSSASTPMHPTPPPTNTSPPSPRRTVPAGSIGRRRT